MRSRACVLTREGTGPSSIRSPAASSMGGFDAHRAEASVWRSRRGTLSFRPQETRAPGSAVSDNASSCDGATSFEVAPELPDPPESQAERWHQRCRQAVYDHVLNVGPDLRRLCPALRILPGRAAERRDHRHGRQSVVHAGWRSLVKDRRGLGPRSATIVSPWPGRGRARSGKYACARARDGRSPHLGKRSARRGATRLRYAPKIQVEGSRPAVVRSKRRVAVRTCARIEP